MSKTPEIETVDPIQVTVVEPPYSPAFKVGAWLGALGLTFLYAWFVQMLLPIVLEIQWDYWRCFWLIVLLRLIVPRAGFRFFNPRHGVKKEVKS